MLSDISAVPVSSMPYRGYTLVGTENDIKEVQQVQASGRPLWYICSGRYAAMGPGFFVPLYMWGWSNLILCSYVFHSGIRTYLAGL